MILGKTVVLHFQLFWLLFYLRMDGLWISLSFRNPQVFHGALGFRVLVVDGFSKGFSHFGENGGFRVFVYFNLF